MRSHQNFELRCLLLLTTEVWGELYFGVTATTVCKYTNPSGLN